MAKDYAKRSNKKQLLTKNKKKSGKTNKQAIRQTTKKRQTKKNYHSWRLFLVIIILLAVVLGIFYYASLTHHSNFTTTPKGTTSLVTQTIDTHTEPSRPRIKTNFIFQPGPDSGQKNTPYFLQLGTFPLGDKLTALQSAIKDDNIHAQYLEFSRDGLTVYRIQIGPFKTKDLAREMQNQLDHQQVYSILSQ